MNIEEMEMELEHIEKYAKDNNLTFDEAKEELELIDEYHNMDAPYYWMTGDPWDV